MKKFRVSAVILKFSMIKEIEYCIEAKVDIEAATEKEAIGIAFDLFWEPLDPLNVQLGAEEIK